MFYRASTLLTLLKILRSSVGSAGFKEYYIKQRKQNNLAKRAFDERITKRGNRSVKLISLITTYMTKKRFTLCLRKYRPKPRLTTRSLFHFKIFPLKYNNPDTTTQICVLLKPVDEVTTSHFTSSSPRATLLTREGCVPILPPFMCLRLPYLVNISLYDKKHVNFTWESRHKI